MNESELARLILTALDARSTELAEIAVRGPAKAGSVVAWRQAELTRVRALITDVIEEWQR